MKKIKILVIGATGFIGKHLVRRLSEEGYKVRCLVREKSRKEDVDYLKKFNSEIVYGNLNDSKTLVGIDKNIDLVFYLAGGGEVASLSKRDFLDLYDYNIKTLENFLKSIKKIKKIIFFSSISVIGVQKNELIDEKTLCTPYLPHEKCKFFAEELIKKYSKIKKYIFSILRPSIVYGENSFGDSFKVIKMIDKGYFFMPGDGKNITPWIYIENVIDAAILLIDKGDNETYIINHEEKISFNRIIKFISKKLDKRIILIHVSLFILKPLVYIQEKFFLLFKKSPIINTYRLKSMTSDRMYSINKIKKIGYKEKINFEQGMTKTINWYKNEYL